jgi:nucleoside-diphosphate-sugar epimerase
MRVVIIGGTGHIGTYLTPMLVNAGHSVLSVSRSKREPYSAHPAWRFVEKITLDRQAEEQLGSFGERISALQPDVVVDLTCYTLESARSLVEALRGKVQHFLHCGTIWVHGRTVETPTTEDRPRRPISDYGVRKAAIEEFLLGEARKSRFPATVLHPGHLVGPGWPPLNPVANFNTQVFSDLAHGREVAVPNFGMETVHHVHAEDVAQAFRCAIDSWGSAVGESFHVVSPAAITLSGYAETVAAWFEQTAKLRFVPWDEWRATVTAREAEITWDHIARSPNCSIEKVRRLLNYQPRYTSMEAVKESLQWLRSNGALDV